MFVIGISKTFLECNLHIFSQTFITANKTEHLVKINSINIEILLMLERMI